MELLATNVFNIICKIWYWKEKKKINADFSIPFLLLLLLFLDEKRGERNSFPFEIIISEIRYESVESCLDGCNELPANWGNEHTYRAFPSRLLIPHCVVRAARDTRGELPPHVHKKVKRPFLFLLLLLFFLFSFSLSLSSLLRPTFFKTAGFPELSQFSDLSNLCERISPKYRVSFHKRWQSLQWGFNLILLILYMKLIKIRIYFNDFENEFWEFTFDSDRSIFFYTKYL